MTENGPENVTIEQLQERIRKLEEENLKWMQLAGTNHLTDLPNSLMLFKLVLPDELRKFGSETGLACLLLSPDGMGSLNQEYGRDVGDQIIKEMAKFLAEKIGENERLFHPDGSNFAILISNSTEAEAERRATEIMMEFAETPIVFEDQEFIGMTCSASVAALEGVIREEDISDSVEQLNHDLSVRLHKAKQGGGSAIIGSG